jgi:hypothetical protein
MINAIDGTRYDLEYSHEGFGRNLQGWAATGTDIDGNQAYRSIGVANQAAKHMAGGAE